MVKTLHDLIQSAGEIVDVVVHDEFTYDIVARVDGQLAVFDAT